MAGPVRDAILQHLAAGHTVERRDATRLFGPLALSVLSQLTSRGAVSRQHDTYAARIRAIPDPQLAAIEARERQERDAQARRRVAESMAAEAAERAAERERAKERRRLIDQGIAERRQRAQALAALPEADRPRFIRQQQILSSFAGAIEAAKNATTTPEALDDLGKLFNLDMDE